MDQITAILKALSDKNRLRVVAALLDHDELCACQLTELIQVTGATASRHMGVLLSSGLVESRKEGRWVYYRLRREAAAFSRLIEWITLQMAGDATAEADRRKLDAITACDKEDLCRRQRGEVCCPKR